jgi:hypothetical protein
MIRTSVKFVFLLIMLISSWVYLPPMQTMSFAEDGPWAEATFYVH